MRRWQDLPRVDRIETSPLTARRQRRAWNGISGVFYALSGAGRLTVHDAAGGASHWRARDPYFRRLENWAQQHVRREAILHVGVDDNDLFFVLRTYPDSALAKALWSIIDDFPNLYFLHWNPAIMDDENGFLGPRSVPIPDLESFGELPSTAKAGTFDGNSNTPVFGWRGGSTGMFVDYRQSDRATVVFMMNDDPDLAKVSDVGFSDLGQNVDHSTVPGRYVKGRQNASEMGGRAFVLDIDGNTSAWSGLRWKLASGTPVVKVRSPFVQWYYPLLHEGEHLLLWDIDGPDARGWIKSLAQLAAADYPRFAQMGENAAAFAMKHLAPAGALLAAEDALKNLDDYDRPRDWRIRPR